ncbi:MAG: hypothetical protein WEB00_06820 [Dehalococcoidia bacterium]
MKLVLVLLAAGALSGAAACDPDDSDVTEGRSTATAGETVEPTEAGGGGGTPTADEPGDGSVRRCADDPGRVIPAILGALDAGDADYVFSCLTEQSRQTYGPDVDTFASGTFNELAAGLGSFSNETPVALAEEIEGLDGVAVAAIAGDREVEGESEENAVYAGVLLFEDGSWRLHLDEDYEFTNLGTEPFGLLPSGPLAITFDIAGVEDPGEGPGSLGEGEGIYAFLDGEAVAPGRISVGYTDGSFNVSVSADADAGPHVFIVFFAHDGGYAAHGWSFTAE